MVKAGKLVVYRCVEYTGSLFWYRWVRADDDIEG